MIYRTVELAEKSFRRGCFPNGSLVAEGRQIVAQSMSSEEYLWDPTAHAEVVAVRNACESLQSRFLRGHTLYTALEPCLIGLYTAYWAGIRTIVYECHRASVSQKCYEGNDSSVVLATKLHEPITMVFQPEESELVSQLLNEWETKSRH